MRTIEPWHLSTFPFVAVKEPRTDDSRISTAQALFTPLTNKVITNDGTADANSRYPNPDWFADFPRFQLTHTTCDTSVSSAETRCGPCASPHKYTPLGFSRSRPFHCPIIGPDMALNDDHSRPPHHHDLVTSRHMHPTSLELPRSSYVVQSPSSFHPNGTKFESGTVAGQLDTTVFDAALARSSQQQELSQWEFWNAYDAGLVDQWSVNWLPNDFAAVWDPSPFAHAGAQASYPSVNCQPVYDNAPGVFSTPHSLAAAPTVPPISTSFVTTRSASPHSSHHPSSFTLSPLSSSSSSAPATPPQYFHHKQQQQLRNDEPVVPLHHPRPNRPISMHDIHAGCLKLSDVDPRDASAFADQTYTHTYSHHHRPPSPPLGTYEHTMAEDAPEDEEMGELEDEEDDEAEEDEAQQHVCSSPLSLLCQPVSEAVLLGACRPFKFATEYAFESRGSGDEGYAYGLCGNDPTLEEVLRAADDLVPPDAQMHGFDY